jgi:hypothetical protein
MVTYMHLSEMTTLYFLRRAIVAEANMHGIF